MIEDMKPIPMAGEEANDISRDAQLVILA